MRTQRNHEPPETQSINVPKKLRGQLNVETQPDSAPKGNGHDNDETQRVVARKSKRGHEARESHHSPAPLDYYGKEILVQRLGKVVSFPRTNPHNPHLAPLVMQLCALFPQHGGLERAKVRQELAMKAVERRLYGKPKPGESLVDKILGRKNGLTRLVAEMNGGHLDGDTQSQHAPKTNGGHKDAEIQSDRAGGGNGHVCIDTQFTGAVKFAAFQAQIMPYLAAIEPLIAALKEMEDRVETLAEQFPVWRDWGCHIRGFGVKTLGLIIGSNGDLANYANPGKLWKRNGYDPNQRRIVGKDAESRQLATAMGYNPHRRAMIRSHVGEPLLKLNDGKYRADYDSYKVLKQAEHPEWETEKIIKDGKQVKAHPGHVHKMAMVHMEKLFLKDLWIAWNGGHGCREIQR